MSDDHITFQSHILHVLETFYIVNLEKKNKSPAPLQNLPSKHTHKEKTKANELNLENINIYITKITLGITPHLHFSQLCTYLSFNPIVFMRGQSI